jgi:hypothetical protein
MELLSLTRLDTSKSGQDIGDDEQKLIKDFQGALQQNAKDSLLTNKDENQRFKGSNQDEAIDEKKVGDTVKNAADEKLDLLKDREDDKEKDKDKDGSTEPKSVDKLMFIVEEPGKKETFELTIESQIVATENGATVNENFSLRQVKLELDDKLQSDGGLDIGLSGGF